jgi:hypothetical protein
MLDWPAPGPCDGVSLWPAIRGGRLDQPRRAYSQAFVAQADEAFDAQRQCLAGDETRAVRHVLYKEAVYDGDHKLSRRHYVPGSENHVPVPCAPVVHLEQLDAGQRLRTAADDAVTRHLSGLLDGYGGSPRDAGPSPPIPPELRRHLENHGYLQGRERHPRR